MEKEKNRVKIRVFGYLRDITLPKLEPGGYLSIPYGSTVRYVTECLNIARFRGKVLVNGESATEEQVLKEGDEIKVMPMVGGG